MLLALRPSVGSRVDLANAARRSVLFPSTLRLNLAWQPIFFKLKKLGLAQFENLLVLGTAFATMGAFYKARTPRPRFCRRHHQRWVHAPTFVASVCER